MSAMDVIAVSLVALALIHALGLALFIAAMLQVRRAAEAVEVVAYQAQDQMAALSDATEKVRGFAGIFQSGWFKLLGLGLGVAATVLPRFLRGNRPDGGNGGPQGGEGREHVRAQR